MCRYCNAQNRMRMRIYNVLEDVRRGHAFVPIITPPSESPDLKPRVDWVRFHETRQAPNLPGVGLRADNHLHGTLGKPWYSARQAAELQHHFTSLASLILIVLIANPPAWVFLFCYTK